MMLFVDKRKKFVPKGYTEKHHIVPRSLGGDGANENIIILTAREHFICHYLLTKMFLPRTHEWYKMINAFIMMNAFGEKERYINSRLYESKRIFFAETMSVLQTGAGNSQFGTKWIYNLDLEMCKKIPKQEDIPEGWTKGRIQNFKIFKSKQKEKELKAKLNKKQKEKDELIDKEKYSKLFNRFKNGNYNSLTQFVNEINFEHSRQALIRKWQQHINFPTLAWGKNFTSKDAVELSKEKHCEGSPPAYNR